MAYMNDAYDYPQTFKDGSKLLIGTNIVDCGDVQLVDDNCTPDTTFVYPLRFNTAADGSGAGGSIRELRLHPDEVHLEFNAEVITGSSISEYAYFGRLQFNPAPTTGTPLAPRYDIINVTTLFNADSLQPITVSGHELFVNHEAISVGESRGFSGDGNELTYVGYSAESCNIDVFAVNLATGAVRRLTQHPEYCDPVSFSPDNKWMAVMDTRGSGRDMFMAGMRYVPPLIDLVVNTISASVRNNGNRRFFEPYLLDYWGDRGTYFGQKINGDNNGTAGSGAINDPQWNGQADPRWSPDSTQLVFWQTQAISPACGGANPLPCYPSDEPGGRSFRMMLVTFVDRSPTEPLDIAEHQDEVPWGVPYVPGSAAPVRPSPPTGIYTLKGGFSGTALVNITQSSPGVVGSVGVVYVDYSDDGLNFLNGVEYAEGGTSDYTVAYASWWSDLVMHGQTTATKKTSVDGFHVRIDALTNIFEANGTLTSVVNGTTWLQPLNDA
ncbi:hypothetical protein SBRCBS47491_003496 [Sporothrix bragantina]|uniref:Saponin hydrolase n=1 Tax=Sporothrix bragantina TaxID=671064 RepID=A0ABP0BGN5_9PEZI